MGKLIKMRLGDPANMPPAMRKAAIAEARTSGNLLVQRLGRDVAAYEAAQAPAPAPTAPAQVQPTPYEEAADPRRRINMGAKRGSGGINI
jgi:hypothetical protein